jgi:septal ring-binding cell division protein DamX
VNGWNPNPAETSAPSAGANTARPIIIAETVPRPTYSQPRRHNNSRQDAARNTRSYSTTTSGAVTMTSLQPKPTKPARPAAASQSHGRLASTLRITPYSNSRKHAPIIDSQRCTM